jgi:hypothetical protein
MEKTLPDPAARAHVSFDPGKDKPRQSSVTAGPPLLQTLKRAK